MKRFIAGLQLAALLVVIMAGATWTGYKLYGLIAPVTLESAIDRAIEKGLSRLPDPAREKMRVRLEQMKPMLKDTLIEFRKERHEMMELFKADKPDQKAIEAHFVRLRELSTKAQMTYQKLVLDGMMELTPEERREAIAVFEKFCRGDTC